MDIPKGGNQEPQIEEIQKMWWPNQNKKDKMTERKKDKRTNTDLQNFRQKIKNRATWTPLKTGGELRCHQRVGSSCSTRCTHCVTLVINPLISHERGKDRIVITRKKHIRGHLWHRYLATKKTFEMMTSTLPLELLGVVASLLAAKKLGTRSDYKNSSECFNAKNWTFKCY